VPSKRPSAAGPFGQKRVRPMQLLLPLPDMSPTGVFVRVSSDQHRDEPQDGLSRIELMGLPLARVTGEDLLSHLFQALDSGRGGWLLTANLDILRRFAKDAEARGLYGEATVAVADGMPLVWASALRGDPLPERVAGSSMVWSLAERAAVAGRSLYLLGGAEGAADGARTVLEDRYPGLRVCGAASPMLSSIPSGAELSALSADVLAAKPDIVLVAFGSPKQEYVIRHLRALLPRAWLIGVGISLSFVTGQTRRAPMWMQRIGLEWVHRMSQEPSRLARRYLLHDIPFALELFAHAAVSRVKYPG